MPEKDKAKEANNARRAMLALAICFCALTVPLCSCSRETDKNDNMSEGRKSQLRFYEAEGAYMDALERADTEQKKWDLTVEYDNAGWLTYGIIQSREIEPLRPAAADIAKWSLQRKLVFFLQQPDRVGNILRHGYPEVVSRLQWTVHDLEDIGGKIDSEGAVGSWGSESRDGLIGDCASEWSYGELAQKLLTRLVNQNFKTQKQFDEWFSVNRNRLVWDPATKTFVIGK